MEGLNYSIDELIDVIVSAVEDLPEIGELVVRPYPLNTFLTLGSSSFKNNKYFDLIFKSGWGAPLLQQTWPNFKLDFTTAHQEQHDTDAIIDELGFSSANAIVAQILDQLRAEVPAETEAEPHFVTITPSPLYDNLPTANTVQIASDPDIASLMASMMAGMETMRARLEESDAERRDSNGQFGSRQRRNGRGYYNGRGRGRGRGRARSAARGERTTYKRTLLPHSWQLRAHRKRMRDTHRRSQGNGHLRRHDGRIIK